MLTEPQKLAAEAAARRRIIDAGYADLIANGFVVQWKRRTLPGTTWLGQYIPHTVDESTGPVVVVAIDRHENYYEAVDTIVHELGHALWEWLDDDSQESWRLSARGHELGPEEAFADEFMHLTAQPYLMKWPELFALVTSKEQPPLE